MVWYSNGNANIQCVYRDGKYHGEYRKWYEDENLEFQTNYNTFLMKTETCGFKHHVKRNGYFTEWNPNGKILGTEWYK